MSPMAYWPTYVLCQFTSSRISFTTPLSSPLRVNHLQLSLSTRKPSSSILTFLGYW